MRPYNVLLLPLLLVACGGDPVQSPNDADAGLPTLDRVAVDTSSSDTLDVQQPDVVRTDGQADTGDTATDAQDAPADVARADASDATAPADGGGADAGDASSDAYADGGADAGDAMADAAGDVAPDAVVCLEGWRQCNGRVLELCQSNRWVADPSCVMVSGGFDVSCYANTCFAVCRTDACITNGGGAGHEGVCRTDADCSANGITVRNVSGDPVTIGNGRCEGGFCATRVARTRCPAAGSGMTCFDLLPNLPRTFHPENNGCTTAGAGNCGPTTEPCESDFDCPRTYRCAADGDAGPRLCLPR